MCCVDWKLRKVCCDGNTVHAWEVVTSTTFDFSRSICICICTTIPFIMFMLPVHEKDVMASHRIIIRVGLVV